MDFADVRLPRWLRWSAVAFVAAGILFASVLDSPSSSLPSLGPLGVFGLDKWLHALAYAALAATLAVALAPGDTLAPSVALASDRKLSVVAALAALLAVGYGVGIEFVQAPLATRQFSVADMAADAVGAGLGVLGWRFGVGLLGRNQSEIYSESET